MNTVPHDDVSLSGSRDILLSRVRRKLSRVAEMQESVQQSLELGERDAAMYLKSAIDRRIQMQLSDTTHEVLNDCLVEYANFSIREQLFGLGMRMNSGLCNNTASEK